MPMTLRERGAALLKALRGNPRIAQGGRVQPRDPQPGEWSCVIHPAMHFDSREDMERYIFGREPE